MWPMTGEKQVLRLDQDDWAGRLLVSGVAWLTANGVNGLMCAFLQGREHERTNLGSWDVESVLASTA